MKQQAKNLLNEEIKAKIIDLVDENGEMHQGLSRSEALKMAEERFLDLVEVNPLPEKSVCKLMDYGKHTFEQNKTRKKSAVVAMKEVKLRPSTDVHDIETKANNIKRFLSKKHDVKISVQFKGRENAHKDQGRTVIDRVLASLNQGYATKQDVTVAGNIMSMVIKAA